MTLLETCIQQKWHYVFLGKMYSAKAMRSAVNSVRSPAATFQQPNCSAVRDRELGCDEIAGELKTRAEMEKLSYKYEHLLYC